LDLEHGYIYKYDAPTVLVATLRDWQQAVFSFFVRLVWRCPQPVFHCRKKQIMWIAFAGAD
jgi:hypothetical protein